MIVRPFPLAMPQPPPELADSEGLILWAIVAAIGLHIAIGIVMALLPAERPQEPTETRVDVTLLTPNQFDSLSPPHLAPPVETPPHETAPPTAASLTEATSFYSGKLLADPRSRQARAALPHLAPEERIIQLCNIEALEQVHSADREHYSPDIVVPYAFAELKLTDHAVDADGGAFRSRKAWYKLRFRCAVAADLIKVTEFAFQIGAAIPHPEWASHNLTIDDEAQD